MSTIPVTPRWFLPTRDQRTLLVKWVVALLVPVAIFILWSGEAIINNALLTLLAPGAAANAALQFSSGAAVENIIFILIFYASLAALSGYLVAADSGRRGPLALWIEILCLIVAPLILVIATSNLLIGLGLGTIVWAIYFFVRKRIRDARHYTPPPPLENVHVLDATERRALLIRARSGGFWFGTALALFWLIIDGIFIASGPFPSVLIIWVVARTLLLPLAGYFLGQLGGMIALRRTLNAQEQQNNGRKIRNGSVSKADQLKDLSRTRAREEARDLVPNDQPLQSRGARNLYMLLLLAFVIFYPVLDQAFFSYGTAGRLTSYGDMGYYIILALGLNIVVGFAGLLDLGYVAFFVIGTYVWAMLGSSQFTLLTHIVINQQSWSWLFWPVLIVAALIAALWGILLGAPTLRLRGDYLAIVTLGFGEIIPIVFLNLDKYTNGTNGISGIFPPATPCLFGFCINWNSSLDPTPFYYLILILIAFSIFANVRLRDSRIGRAWVAIREDEIAASSSGVNLVNTKLMAFAAGAFFSGIAGAYHAAKLGAVNPTDFSSTDSIMFLAMVVIGGLGSIPGVIVGAVVVYALNVLVLSQLDSMALDPNNFLHFVKVLMPNFAFSDIRNLLFGLMLILIMIFRPEGLLPSARRRRELHNTTATAEDLGALDVTPGTAGFEEEVRVD